MNKERLPLVLLQAVVMAGCVSYNGDLTPKSPKPNSVQFYFPVAVDSLRPTIQWEAKDPSRPVELSIWEAVYKGGNRSNISAYEIGPVAYSKKNILGSEHKVEQDLPPGAFFFWSVRYAGTIEWATASREANLGVGWESVRGSLFFFETPKQ